MEVDTGKTSEFRGSPRRTVFLLLGSLAMGALSLAVGMRLLLDVSPGGFTQFAGFAGGVFFGVCFLLSLGRLFTVKQATLSLSPDGFRDIRISPEWVPWSTVHHISSRSLLATKIIVVKIPDEACSSLRLTKAARWSRSQNKSLGVDGLATATVDLDVKVDELLAIMNKYNNAHLIARLNDYQNRRFENPISPLSKELAHGIDYDFNEPGAWLKPFPHPDNVFIPSQVKLCEYLHPLISIDLAAINPEWSGFVHLLSPIEPTSGYVGDGTEIFYNEYANENCLIFKIEHGKYRFSGKTGYFLKTWDRADIPADRLSEYDELIEQYETEERSYQVMSRRTGEPVVCTALMRMATLSLGTRRPSHFLRSLEGLPSSGIST